MKPEEKAIKGSILNNFTTAAKEQGFKKVSLDELAAGLGISKKTVYKYFPGKKQLVAASLKKINSEMDDLVKDILESPQPTRELMIKALTGIFMYMSANFNLIQDMHRYYPEQWTAFDKQRAARIKQAEQLIQRGIDQGQFKNIDPRIVSHSYIAAVQTVINPGFLKNKDINFDDAYKALIQIFLNGVLI